MNSESNYKECPNCGSYVSKKKNRCSECGKKLGRGKRYILIGLVGLGLLAVLGQLGESEEENIDTTALALTTASNKGLNPEEVSSTFLRDHRTEMQEAFVKVVEGSVEESKNAKNEMQRGGILAERSQKICKILKSKSIKDWAGTVKKVDSNSEGKGVLSIEISDNIIITTWNNSISDIIDETLLLPGSEIFSTASQLMRGQNVKFSGSFINDAGACIGEQSITLRGKVENPEFTFRFDALTPIK